MEPIYEMALKEIEHCNKCGFCLPACPTYRLTGNEVDSPRGRIAMVEGVLNDEIAAGEGFEASLTYCLGCRACETACPSGVQYHRVLEAGKRVLDATRPGHRGMTWIPRTLLKMTKRPKRMGRLARLGQRVEDWPLPKRITALMPMLHYQHEDIVVGVAPKESTNPVGFFRGCVQEALFSDANQAARELLKACGYEVMEPSMQGCCGALAWHSGRAEEARLLARVNISAFEASGMAPVVNTAGGCGAMLSEYGEILSDDPKWAQRALRFSERVKDWSTCVFEKRDELHFKGQGDRVTLQNSCHLLNVEGGGDIPQLLIGLVEEDRFLPLPSQDRCCGSAGIYNIQHPDWANRLLDEKMAEVAMENPSRVLVVNPGCQLQMTLGMSRAGQVGEVEHLARYLYRAFVRAQGKSQGGDDVE